MAVRIKRQPDGWAAYYLDNLSGITYITFQLEGSVVDIKWAKPPKTAPIKTIMTTKDLVIIDGAETPPRKRGVVNRTKTTRRKPLKRGTKYE